MTNPHAKAANPDVLFEGRKGEGGEEATSPESEYLPTGAYRAPFARRGETLIAKMKGESPDPRIPWGTFWLAPERWIVTNLAPEWTGCRIVLPLLLLGLSLAVPLQACADTVHIQIEFSEGTPRGYTLTKAGSFSSGVTALNALFHALGGAAQFFDPPYAPSPSVSGNWIQWWRWGFGLSVTGMSLDGQTNGDWNNNYWALYTRDSAASPFVSSWVGLADLVPADGSWLALKFIGLDGGPLPEENVTFQSVSFTAPPNPDPPRVLSLRRTSPESLEVVFSTVPGATYRLEASTLETVTSWTPWVDSFVATSSSTIFNVPIHPDEPRKFFRLALLP